MGVENRDKKPFFIIDDSDSKVSLDDNLYEDFENMNRAAFYLFKHYGCLDFYRCKGNIENENVDFLIGLSKNHRYVCSLNNERDASVSRYVSKIVKENLNKISSFRNLKRRGTQVFAHRLKNINHNQGSTVFLFYMDSNQYSECCDKYEDKYKSFRLDNPYKMTKTVATLVPCDGCDGSNNIYNNDSYLEMIGKVYNYGYSFVNTGKNNRILKEYRPISLDDESNNEKKSVVNINFGNDISVGSFGQQDQKTNYTNLEPKKTTKLNVLTENN